MSVALLLLFGTPLRTCCFTQSLIALRISLRGGCQSLFENYHVQHFGVLCYLINVCPLERTGGKAAKIASDLRVLEYLFRSSNAAEQRCSRGLKLSTVYPHLMAVWVTEIHRFSNHRQKIEIWNKSSLSWNLYAKKKRWTRRERDDKCSQYLSWGHVTEHCDVVSFLGNQPLSNVMYCNVSDLWTWMKREWRKQCPFTATTSPSNSFSLPPSSTAVKP